FAWLKGLRQASRQNLSILPQLPAARIHALGPSFKPFAKLKAWASRESLFARFQAQAGLLCKKWG
ncbi:MAG TPA: hypothetical protein DEA73_10130, partial [Peptococcaceae bacterium]|nr:hypothetical protein [Peptococcaceae bacterium]